MIQPEPTLILWTFCKISLENSRFLVETRFGRFLKGIQSVFGWTVLHPWEVRFFQPTNRTQVSHASQRPLASDTTANLQGPTDPPTGWQWWWFQLPNEKYGSTWEFSSIFRGENEEYLKPPPRLIVTKMPSSLRWKTAGAAIESLQKCSPFLASKYTNVSWSESFCRDIWINDWHNPGL